MYVWTVRADDCLSQGREIKLTAKEFDLMELMVKTPEKVYSRETSA